MSTKSADAYIQALLVYAAHTGAVRLFWDAPGLAPRGEDHAAYRRHLVFALIPGAARCG